MGEAPNINGLRDLTADERAIISGALRSTAENDRDNGHASYADIAVQLADACDAGRLHLAAVDVGGAPCPRQHRPKAPPAAPE